MLFICELARLFFVIYNFPLFKGIDFSEIAKSFFYGLKLDCSLAAYLSIPFVLILFLSAFIGNNKFLKISLIVYSLIIVIVASIIVIADAETYIHWAFRLDKTPLYFLKTPQAVTGNITVSKLILLIFLSLCFATISFLIIWFFVIKNIKNIKREKYFSFLYIPLFGVLFIILRGGVGIVPINQGSVYYSTNTLCNNTAINVIWNLVNSFVHSDIDYDKFKYFNEEEKENICKEINDYPQNDSLNYRFSENPDNIIFVVLESFTADAQYLV